MNNVSRVALLFVSSLVFLPACTVTTHGGGRSGAAQGGINQGGPRFLGERTVNGAVDHDVIEVGADEGRFHAIQIDVDGSAMEMFDITITFGDGQQFSPATRLVFGKGSESRVIDLPGGERIIRRIDFRYGNLPGGGRAHVVARGI